MHFVWGGQGNHLQGKVSDGMMEMEGRELPGEWRERQKKLADPGLMQNDCWLGLQDVSSLDLEPKWLVLILLRLLHRVSLLV